jgi:hypothetical protein
MPIRCINQNEVIIQCPESVQTNCNYLGFVDWIETFQCTITTVMPPAVSFPAVTPRTGGTPSMFGFIFPALLVVIGVITIIQTFKKSSK